MDLGSQKGRRFGTNPTEGLFPLPPSSACRGNKSVMTVQLTNAIVNNCQLAGTNSSAVGEVISFAFGQDCNFKCTEQRKNVLEHETGDRNLLKAKPSCRLHPESLAGWGLSFLGPRAAAQSRLTS